MIDMHYSSYDREEYDLLFDVWFANIPNIVPEI